MTIRGKTVVLEYEEYTPYRPDLTGRAIQAYDVKSPGVKLFPESNFKEPNHFWLDWAVTVIVLAVPAFLFFTLLTFLAGGLKSQNNLGGKPS